MFTGCGSMAFLAALGVLLLAGAGARQVGPIHERESVDLCKEQSVTSVSCSEASDDGLLANPDDCRVFYKCASAEAEAVCVPCPPGLHYNAALRVCDHPERAGCDPALLQPIDAGNQHGDNIPPRCIQNSVTPVSCSEVEAPESLVAHPDDCELFYYCVSAASSPVCRQCPAGLHFNPDKLVCDNAADAGCLAYPPTSTESSDKQTDQPEA